MQELSTEEYRKIHRQLGGAPENFESWLAAHRTWEQQRLAQVSRPSGGKARAKRGREPDKT